MISFLVRKIKLFFLSYFNQSGFTLIELLISVFIISFFSAFLLVYRHSAEESLSFERAVYQAAQDIRRVEAMAIGAEEWQGQYPQGGFGIRFVTMSSPVNYIIFADSNGDGDYQASELIETRTLEKGVRNIEVNPSPLIIIFKAPDPEVILPSGYDEIDITLEGLKTRYINVNKTGRIKIW